MSEVVYNRIAMLRAERGVSRRQLADALGVHYQTIGYLERGEYSPSLYLALRIAGVLRDPGRGDLLNRPVPEARQRQGLRLGLIPESRPGGRSRACRQATPEPAD